MSSPCSPGPEVREQRMCCVVYVCCTFIICVTTIIQILLCVDQGCCLGLSLPPAIRLACHTTTSQQKWPVCCVLYLALCLCFVSSPGCVLRVRGISAAAFQGSQALAHRNCRPCTAHLAAAAVNSLRSRLPSWPHDATHTHISHVMFVSTCWGFACWIAALP